MKSQKEHAVRTLFLHADEWHGREGDTGMVPGPRGPQLQLRSCLARSCLEITREWIHEWTLAHIFPATREWETYSEKVSYGPMFS